MAEKLLVLFLRLSGHPGWLRTYYVAEYDLKLHFSSLYLQSVGIVDTYHHDWFYLALSITPGLHAYMLSQCSTKWALFSVDLRFFLTLY